MGIFLGARPAIAIRGTRSRSPTCQAGPAHGYRATLTPRYRRHDAGVIRACAPYRAHGQPDSRCPAARAGTTGTKKPASRGAGGLVSASGCFSVHALPTFAHSAVLILVQAVTTSDLAAARHAHCIRDWPACCVQILAETVRIPAWRAVQVRIRVAVIPGPRVLSQRLRPAHASTATPTSTLTAIAATGNNDSIASPNRSHRVAIGRRTANRTGARTGPNDRTARSACRSNSPGLTAHQPAALLLTSLPVGSPPSGCPAAAAPACRAGPRGLRLRSGHLPPRSSRLCPFSILSCDPDIEPVIGTIARNEI